MSRLSDLKRRVGESAEAAKAISELTEFTTILTLGTTSSGGALTLPLILVQSGKAAGALFDLAKILLSEDVDSTIQEREPADRADDIFYIFAQRAFLNALNRLEGKLPKSARVNDEKYQELARDLETAVLRPDQAEAAFQFGWNPQSGPLQLFESYKIWMTTLLIAMGAEEKKAQEWLNSVEIDARKGLFSQLVSKKKDRTWMVHYQLLENTTTIIDLLKGFSSPDTSPSDLAWHRYLSDLAQKPSLPIWGEEAQGLGIDKLFVEASYTYSRQLPSGMCILGNPANNVSLKAFLTGLVSRRRPSTELVFVMGGPGTGKTSLMEVLCGELAQSKAIPVVLIPAKRLDPRRALLLEIQNYLREKGHGSLAELITTTQDCVLAIDGFDELAHATLSTLESFFRSAQELVRERSSSHLRVLLSGRPTLFSANDVSIPAGSHVITLQPFNRNRVAKWSENWRTATGGSFDGTIYLNSQSPDIRDLATQPMLLYLLAKMHEEGVPIPENFPLAGGVRFQIYEKILNWVCHRQEEKKIPTSFSVRLRRFLQVAGLATHQSGQRTLHWRQFAKALEQAGLVEDPRDVDAKVHSTILAFAFTSLEDRAWEFTHKSFGEALAAEAMGRVLEDISEEGRDGEPWRVALPVAAKMWIETFGPHFLTKDVLDFCSGWLQTKGSNFSERLMLRLIEVLNQLLGRSAADALATVSVQLERPIQVVLGNAIRSWFALCNENLDILIRSGGSNILQEWRNSVGIEQFRAGVYLSNLVSPISAGEATMLFRWPSTLLPTRENHHSPQYLRQLLNLASSLSVTLTTGGIKNSGIPKLQQQLLFNEYKLHSSTHWIHRDPRDVFYIDWLSSPLEKGNVDFAPLESLFAEIENTLSFGFEPNPLVEAMEKIGLQKGDRISAAEAEQIFKVLRQLLSIAGLPELLQ